MRRTDPVSVAGPDAKAAPGSSDQTATTASAVSARHTVACARTWTGERSRSPRNAVLVASPTFIAYR